MENASKEGSMFRYCPGCASERISFERNKVFRCPDCGFTYYHNTAAATACIVKTAGGLLFLVRGKEPGKGKLDLPGGFVDPGEGALEGLRRELQEEIGWDPGLLVSSHGTPGTGKRKCELFESFPNTYPYRGISYNTCDLFFLIDAPELEEKNIVPEPGEVSALRFVKDADVNLDDFAFESAKRALKSYLNLQP